MSLGRILVVTFLASSCASTDEPLGGTAFTVWVFDERVTPDGEDVPLANVRVAFDPPAGDRITKTTEADGHVRFDADFTRGGASVTVLSDEHVYMTMLEASPETARDRPNTIGKPPSDLVVFPPRLDRQTVGRTVELRGTIVGKRDPNDVVALAISSLPRLGTYRTVDPTFILRAPKDRPFFLLGHESRTLFDEGGNVLESELLQSFRIELPARSDDQLLDLDLAKLPSLPIRLLHLRAEAPPSFGAISRTRAFASVASADSGLALGLFAASRPASDGRAFEVDVALVDTDVAPERLVSQAILSAADGSQSVRTEQGTMADGTVWTEFPLPPSIADPDLTRAVTDAIPLDGFPRGADLVANVYAGGQLLWILHGPPGGPKAKSFTIPYRGEVQNPLVNVFALSLTARRDRVALPPRGELYRFESTFRDIRLRKK